MPAIDQLRGLAALWIVGYHTLYLLGHEMIYHSPFRMGNVNPLPETLNPLTAAVLEGNSAVALFMVLSGFIFTRGAYGRQLAYGQFIRNRVLRIYPLFLLLVIFGILTTREPVSLLSIVQTILPVGMMTGTIPWTPFSAMFWSLAIECQFYLIFPLLFMVANTQGTYRTISLLVMTLIALRLFAVLFGASARDLSYFTIAGRLDEFLIGMLAGFIYAEEKIPKAVLRRIFLPVAFLAMGLIFAYYRAGGFYAVSSWKTFQPPVEALIWAAFVLSYIEFAEFLPPLVSRPLAWIGTISYSIYMLHIVVIWGIAGKNWYLVPGFHLYGDLLVNFVLLVLPLVLMLSALTYFSVEKPFLAVRKRYIV
jgi:peptidoglycan/LPS O-acetylase OafA/YrhL